MATTPTTTTTTTSPVPLFQSCSSSYALGLVFIVLVSVIWSAASIFVQYLYNDQSFDSPFLLTYIGTSLFVILLPLEWLYQYCCHRRQRFFSFRIATPSSSFIGGGGGEYESISMHNNHSTTTMTTTTTTNTNHHQAETTDAVPVLHNNNNNNTTTTITNNHNNHSNQKPWTLYDHFVAAGKIAPVWFVSNYSYNASLKFTSITSSTVLACTGSLFTFLFALLLQDETFCCYKLMGVLLGMTGSILTGLHDAAKSASGGSDGNYNNNNDDALTIAAEAAFTAVALSEETTTGNSNNFSQDLSLWGDALGLLSAVGYGGYAIMVRILCPRDESLMKMQIFLGFVGLWNMVLLSPVVIGMYTIHGGSSAPSGLSWLVLGCLIVKGLLDNVLSDYLWARSVVLTSATVASVGLGLTIPLAFLSDVVLGRPNVLNITSIFGALSVLTGFVLVNLGQQQELLQDSAAIAVTEQQQPYEHHVQSEGTTTTIGEETPLEQHPLPSTSSTERLHMSIEYSDETEGLQEKIV